MSSKSTYLIPKIPLRHKCVAQIRIPYRLLFLLFFLLQITISNAQTGVEITSTESNPTSANPIPISIQFADGVDNLQSSDFTLSNTALTNLTRLEPKFEFKNSEILDQFHIGLEDFDLELSFINPVIISIDFYQGDLYYLTYGDGLFKKGEANPVIPGSEFDSPLDFIINPENGTVYIADSGKRQVLIYDASFNYIDAIGDGSNAESDYPRGATGLALDLNGNIYVADNYTGNVENQDAIKIYAPNGSLIKKISLFNSENIEDPFRIAVDNNGNIFLSESGGTNGRILIYDKDYNEIKEIEGGDQGSPGSLVTDDFGYLYVVDFENEFKLNDLLNDPIEVFNNYNKIKNGEYNINVYDPETEFQFLKSFPSNNINIPIDIAINECGKIFLNDLELGGEGVSIERVCIPILGCVDIPTSADLDFTFVLKEYQRMDNFSADLIPTTQGVVQVLLKDKDLFKCDPQPDGKFEILYQSVEENTPPKFTDCPTSNIIKNTDSGQCGAIITFTTPNVEDDNGEIVPTRIDSNTELNSGDVFPVGETVITFQADDNVNAPVQCSFSIIISDNEDPVITNCPADIKESVAFGETGKVIEYSMPTFTDNCDNSTITQTDGIASGEEYPLGTTTNTFVINDGNGNTKTCSFDVVITEETEDTPPIFTDCPTSNIIKNTESGQCGAIINFTIPNVEDDNGVIVPTRIDSNTELNSGDVFPVGETVITFQAYDNVNAPVECSFTITVKDSENPIITNCVDPNLNISLPVGETFELEDFGANILASDNCDENLEITQDPPVGTLISETTQVMIKAVDDAGNFDVCEFTIEVTLEEGEDLVLNCPIDYELVADENCQFIVPNFSEVLSFSPPEAKIEQSIDAGSELTSNQLINITASYEGQVETCNINLIMKSNNGLIVNCPADKEEVLSEVNAFTLPDYRSEVNVSDYCGEIEIVQTPAPNTTITTDSVISFEVMDSFGNSASCSFNLKLVPAGSLVINCPADKVLSKDEDCAVILPDFTSEAEVINGDGSEVTQDPLPGTIITADTLKITLTIENDESADSCTFNVILVDELAPTSILKDATISLNTNGIAVLNSQDIDNGSFDNCSNELEFFLEKTTFSCEELGENVIEVRVEDGNGNETTSRVLVTVIDPSGGCNAIEEPETEYLFLYPNPTQGEVRFMVPKDMNIYTVFVYDSRGRFIFEKSYDRERPNYQLDLSGLQDAIYFLKLYTSKGQLTEKVILRSRL